MNKCKNCNQPCKRKYCNYQCYWKWMKGKSFKNSGQFKKGFVPKNKGIFSGAATYSALHKWLQRNLIKLGICERCGKKVKTEWSNISGIYTRDRKDYLELCKSCHVTEDKRPKRPDFEGRIY